MKTKIKTSLRPDITRVLANTTIQEDKKRNIQYDQQ